MKKLFLCLLFTAAMHSQVVNYSPLSVTATTGDAPYGVIWNPERGFYYDASSIDDDWTPIVGVPFQYNKLTQADCNEAIARGCSLIHRIIRLDDYKTNATISPTFLQYIQDDLNLMKANGLKCVLRFSYSYYEDYQNHTGHVYDAVESIIFSHIDQLKTITRATNNEPVISSIEAGFIGNWGEWHYTFNYGNPATGAITPAQLDARQRIGQKILSLGVSRLVAYRTPFIQRQQTAFGFKTAPGTNAAPPAGGDGDTAPTSRVAAHNDCFLSDVNDQGTYDYGTAAVPYQVDREYLKTQSIHTFDGGEFCGLDSNYANLVGTPTGSSGSYIGNALKQMADFHFNYLNSANGHNDDYVTHYWETHSFATAPFGTYMNEVKRKLGYRFELTSTNLNTTTKEFSITLKNIGFAKMFNFRKTYLVFKNTAPNANPPEYRVRLMTADPRDWLASPTATYTLTKNLINMVTTTGADGVSVPSGTYKLYLYMPDNNVTLNASANSTKYAVRFANANIGSTETFWNTASPLAGYNNLYRTVTINNTAGTVSKMEGSVADQLEVKVYPNPFATAFKLDLATSVEDKVSVNVYDMLGRLIDAKQVNVIDVPSLEIGTDYPAGIYNITITQGTDKKVMRVIKK
ncbi:MAG: DUF4832 domain-containing protein [Flavobacterium sp.]